ncbi:hypothetical protein ATO6_14435 [Oceanicola sp. 22II-s10i]|uniref:LysR family transcriptional regulator n=1 Tax=Oceanicola sp. 22II-s10i TaxID=1317116 RepID=UPI000B755E8A|nr:LysR family transcriptional regulator [Oceanicola sp. 22II-s10i]OWU84230.1 hypothetical protein ATO6_14435 [Oceanicola sp. 22II-s10i]
MRYVLAVADHGGFRCAAMSLNVSQPAVSKSVQDTEADLGYKIFDRHPGGISLTENGRMFVDDARKVVAQFLRAIRSARRNDEDAKGHIIVGYSALAAPQQFSPGLEAFNERQARVQIEMHMRSLKTGEIDVGFLLSHPSVRDDDISQSRLWTTRIGVICPRGHGRPTLDGLRQEKFVMGLRENWRSFRMILDVACEKADLVPYIVDEAWDVHVIFQRVAAGRGMTLYPMSIRDNLPATLEIHEVEGFDAELTIAMAWSRTADTQLLQSFRKIYHDLC